MSEISGIPTCTCSHNDSFSIDFPAPRIYFICALGRHVSLLTTIAMILETPECVCLREGWQDGRQNDLQLCRHNNYNDLCGYAQVCTDAQTSVQREKRCDFLRIGAYVLAN